MARQTHIVHSEEAVRVTVEPLDSPSDLSWFRLFRSVVHSGVWARLTPAAAKVLVVLAECVNDSIRKEQSRWIAWPSIATIALRAGVERRAAQKAIALLEEHGLVRRCRRRNASRGDYSNEYELTPPVTVDAQEGAHERAQGRASVGAPVPATPHARAPRSDKRPPRASAGAQQRTDLTEYSDDSSIRARLAAAGIGEPVLSRLLSTETHDELLLRLKDWELRKSAGGKLGVAWLIASIQQKYELHEGTSRQIELTRKQAAARNHRARELQREAEEEARQRAIDEQVRLMFDEMSDEELAHWKNVVVGEFPSLIRNPDRADPRTHERLRRLILGKLSHVVCPPGAPA